MQTILKAKLCLHACINCMCVRMYICKHMQMCKDRLKVKTAQLHTYIYMYTNTVLTEYMCALYCKFHTHTEPHIQTYMQAHTLCFCCEK